MSYKIFLDDLRMPVDIHPKTKNEDWLIIRNLTDFKKAIEENGVPDFISFDNDLGATLEEGKDAAKWMVYEKWLDISNMDFLVHSANVSGVREFIVDLLNNWKKELETSKMESTGLKKNIKTVLVVAHGKAQEEIMRRHFAEKRKETLKMILNSLEFKDDVINAGGSIYAVGGIVRDAEMAVSSDDLDIVIRGIPYDELFIILSKYGKAVDTSVTTEDGKKDFGATKFVSSNEIFNKLLSDKGIRKDIDVMLPRKDSKEVGGKGHRSIKSEVNHMFTIEDDLERRDITINAIAMDIHGFIISVGNSLEDIHTGIIRAVSEDSFIDDPLRMVRAIRFAAKFKFIIEERTLELIKDNAYLLADKKEMPIERFLMEFEKMIGKADLARAVKLLVELDLYKHMFGIDSKIEKFESFELTKNVAEFSFMLFERESPDKILSLVNRNITNKVNDLNYVKAMVKYLFFVKEKDLAKVDRLNDLASVYNLSNEMLLSSNFVLNSDKEVATKFQRLELPSVINDIAFKGEEFKKFIIDVIVGAGREFNEKIDSAKMGTAKRLAVQAMYKDEISNSKEEIRSFLESNSQLWLN